MSDRKPGRRWIRMHELQAKLSDRSRASIYRDIQRKRLPRPTKVGSILYFDESAVDDSIAAGEAIEPSR